MGNNYLARPNGPFGAGANENLLTSFAKGFSINAFALLVLALDFIDLCRTHEIQPYQYLRKRLSKSTSGRKSQDMMSRLDSSAFHTNKIFKQAGSSSLESSKCMYKKLILYILYPIVHIVYTYFFVVYFQSLSIFARYIDSSGWTFGQVIGVSVWIPGFVDYLHSLFGKSLWIISSWQF